MSDDLIRRLRATQPKDSQYGETAREAAAEIERLQSALPVARKWTIVDGKCVTGETLIFEGTFLVAKVTRREDADAILSLPLQLHDRAQTEVKK